jgi:hypothetical protein
MRRIDLMRERRIITVEELEFGAKLTAWLDQHEAKWQAEDRRRGQPPTKQEQQYRGMWRDMVEEQEWERFYGVVDQGC